MNETLYADRTFQNWHRESMPANADGIDLDFLGVCREWRCRKALYAIESTTRDNKPTTILERLAKDLGCYGIVVVHDTNDITDYTIVHQPNSGTLPRKPNYNSEKELQFLLTGIRHRHRETCRSA
jgi:hypothetical protein